MTTLVLRNARLFDGVSNALRDDVHVVVEDGRVKAVEEGRAPAGDGFDLAGRVLMPGLIDCHVHLVATSANLGVLEREPATLTALKAKQIAEAMLHRGFTAVRDAGGADRGLALATEQGLIAGPRVFYSGRALSQTGGHADGRAMVDGVESCACCLSVVKFAHIADGVDEVRRAARAELRLGATQIKIMASGGVASPSDPIWNLQYSEDEIRAAVWEAESWRTYVMAHAYTPEAISRCVRFGVRSIEHGNLIDRETAALMAEHGAWLVPTLVTYDSLHRYGREYGLPVVSAAKVDDVRLQGLEALAIAKDAGVNIAFGTDLLGGMHKDQSHEFAIRAEVQTPFEILKSATSDAARLLQREGELGTVAPGALADLIAVDGNPLEDVAVLEGQGEAIPLVLKNGQVMKSLL